MKPTAKRHRQCENEAKKRGDRKWSERNQHEKREDGMHEYSLMRALLRQVEALAEQHRAVGVREIVLSVGEFSGVEVELLPLAFAELSQGTLAAAAVLSVESVPLEGICQICERSNHIESFRFLCSACGGPVRVVRGEELLVERILLELEEAGS